MGIADLPDISDEDWNAYTADQFRAATDPILDALRFQHDTATGFDPIFSQVMAQQQADDERRRREEELARQQQMQMQAQQAARQQQMQQASEPYDDLRAMMFAPDPVVNQVDPGYGGLNGPGQPIGPTQPPNNGDPNWFSSAARGLSQFAQESRDNGFSSNPFGTAVTGAAQGLAKMGENIGGSIESFKQGDPVMGALGLAQGVTSFGDPLRGVAKEFGAPETMPSWTVPPAMQPGMQNVTPETPVFGGLTNPQEMAGLVPEAIFDPTDIAVGAAAKRIGPHVGPLLRRGAEAFSDATATLPSMDGIAGGALRLAKGLSPNLYEDGSQPTQGITRGLTQATDETMFHGTPLVFDQIDETKFNDNGLFGPGYYLTREPEVASSYADETRVLNRGNMVKEPDLARMLNETWRIVQQFRKSNDPMEKAFAEQLAHRFPVTSAFAGHAQLDFPTQQGIARYRTINNVGDYANWLDQELVRLRGQQFGGNLPPSLERAQFAKLRASVSSHASDLMDRFGTQAAPNVRKVTVPAGMKLLDLNNPLPDDELQMLDAASRNIAAPRSQGYRALYDDLFTGAKMYAEGRADGLFTRAEDLEAIERGVTGPIGFDYWRALMDATNSSKAEVTELLSHMGYDGIRHMGGLRSPVLRNGVPITHDVDIIFPNKVDKVRNAISGVQRGIMAGEREETQGRFLHGSGFVFDQYDPSRFDDEALFGPGLYGTKDPRLANSYVSKGATGAPKTAQEVFEEFYRNLSTEDTGFTMGGPQDFRLGNRIIDAAFPNRIPQPEPDELAQDYALRLNETVDNVVGPIEDQESAAAHFGMTENEFVLGLQNVQNRIDEVRLNGPAPSNVRPFDVGSDLRLLDADNELPDDELQMIERHLEDLQQRDVIGPSMAPTMANTWGGQQPGARNWYEALNNIYREQMERQNNARGYDETAQQSSHLQGLTGNDVYRGLERFFGGDRKAATQLLSDMGFDGITHKGGLRSGMPDPLTGQPIIHQVAVVFPDKLDRITNSLSGRRGGIVPQSGPPEPGEPSFGGLDDQYVSDTMESDLGIDTGDESQYPQWMKEMLRGDAPSVPEDWGRLQAERLATRAAVSGGAGAVAGGALGGVTGYALGEDDPSDPYAGIKNFAKGAALGAVGAAGGGAVGYGGSRLSDMAAARVINKLFKRGKISFEELNTHPDFENRVQAMMRVMADAAPTPTSPVTIPPLINAVLRMSGQPRSSLSDETLALIRPGITKTEVDRLLGDVDPVAAQRTWKTWLIDTVRALPFSEERVNELGADIGAAEARSSGKFDQIEPYRRSAIRSDRPGRKLRGIERYVREVGEAMGIPEAAFYTDMSDPRVSVYANFPGRNAFEMGDIGAISVTGEALKKNISPDEWIDIIAHEYGHIKQGYDLAAKGKFESPLTRGVTGDTGDTGDTGGGGSLPPDLTPDEDTLPPPESASAYLDRVVNELTPAGREAAKRYGEEVEHRAPWAGNVIEQTERLPEGNRWEQVLRVAQPEGAAAADAAAAIGDAMDAANPAPYQPPVKRPAGPRDDRNLGGTNVLANQPEGMQEMAAQGVAELQQELRASHGFRTEKESREAAERVMEFILPFAREAQPNEPVNEALLRAGREAWAQSHWPSYYAMIDHAKMAADPDADPDLLAAAEQAMNYWQGIRQVLGRYAGEIAPSESGRTFRSMRDVPGPMVPGVTGGSGEAVNRTAKTPREKMYEDILVKMRQSRRGQQAGQDVSTTATQRTAQRVGGKRPNGPLAAMGLEWDDILRRTGNDDVDRTNLLAGLEELGGYRFRRDRTKAAMDLDMSDDAAVGKFWDDARTAAGVDKEMRPFVKFDPNVSGQSYLGGADTITKQQALQMVSKELIKDADEATAALRAARNQGKSPSVLRDLEAAAARAYERMGLRIESWPPDSFPVLRRAAESVRNRIEKEWPADRKAGSGAEEAVEKKRQLLGIFDQELKKEQKLAGIPVTGLQDLMSFGTSNVLTTARFVQASVLESALSSINEPFQAFLRGDYAGAGRQLQGLGRAFGLITSGDIAALGEGIKAPAIVNALRGIKDIGPMQAAGEMREVSERGAGHIRSDSANRLAELMSPMHRVSRGISEAFQTGNYFGEVNRLVHTAAESGILPGGRRIEQIVDETGVKRNPGVRELMGNLPQEIVDAALNQSRFVNEGGHAGWLERQLGDAKGLLNKPGASGGERATGLFANLMFPFVYGLRPMIKSGTRTLFSGAYHGAEFAKAIRAGDGEGAKYAAKKFALANSFNGFIAYHVISGNITGHGPQDPGTRQALMEATDENGDPIWRPDSIRIPNPGGDGHTWVKYTSMPGPVSIVATVMGNMYEAYAFDGKDMESSAETLGRVMPEIAKGVMDNTYFRDMINLVEALNATGGAPGISRVAGQVAGRFVPGAGALRTAATLMDPQQRLATNPWEDIQSGVPGLRERLPSQVSAYSGRPAEQPLSPVTALGGISGNVYASPSERNPIARETVAASRRSLPWEGGVRPSEGLESDVFPRTFTRGEQSRGLKFAGEKQTGEGIRGAQAAFGRESGAEMLRLIESPQYQAADPRLKAQMLTQAANRSGQRGEYAASGAPGVNPSPEKQLERANLQTARFRGVRGSPDEIAAQNQKIAQARETLSDLASRVGRSRAINLLRKSDPEAYRLATRYRPMSQDRLWMQEQEHKARLGIPDDDGQFLIPDFGTGASVIDTTGLPNMQTRRPSQRR